MLKRISYYLPDPQVRLFKILPNERMLNNEMKENLITPEKPKPALITGGVGDDGDYLSPMEIGDEFLAQRMVTALGYDVQHWKVLHKSRFARRLAMLAGVDGEELKMWVKPMEFCTRNRLVEKLNEHYTKRLAPDQGDPGKLDLDV